MNCSVLILALTLIWPPPSHSLPASFSSGMTGAWHRYLGHPFRRRQENEVNNQRLLWSSVLSHHRSKFPLKQEFGQRRSRLWHNFSTLGGRHPWNQTFNQNFWTLRLNQKHVQAEWEEKTGQMGAIGKHIQSEINRSCASSNVNIFLVKPFPQGGIPHLFKKI